MTITTEEAERMAHQSACLGAALSDQYAVLQTHHEEVAAALRALAAERDALLEAVGAHFSAATDYSERWERVQAERDALRKERDDAHRAGILAAAEIVERMRLQNVHLDFVNGFNNAVDDAADAIRAAAKDLQQ